uniref:Uncharacterized protein n=1 Tax=Micrurus lemniscatus lemniscatus TaxID=129467 RepID=A0A2D4JEH5_MICLE
MLAGEFWELKSTSLKVAKFGGPWVRVTGNHDTSSLPIIILQSYPTLYASVIVQAGEEKGDKYILKDVYLLGDGKIMFGGERKLAKNPFPWGLFSFRKRMFGGVNLKRNACSLRTVYR